MVHGGSCYPGLVVLGSVGSGDPRPGLGTAVSEKLHPGSSTPLWVLSLVGNDSH